MAQFIFCKTCSRIRMWALYVCALIALVLGFDQSNLTCLGRIFNSLFGAVS